MRKFFAALFAIGFVLLAPIVIPATVIQLRVFTPSSFKQFVRSAQLGERLPQIAASFIASQANEEGEGIGEIFQQFGGQVLFEKAISSVFPPADVYAILDVVIDKGFVWWQSGKPIQDLDLRIDLSSAKQRLGPIVLDAIQNQIQQLPICSDEDLNAIQNQEGGDIFSLSCKPEGFNLDSLQQAGFSTNQLTQAVLVSVPDQFDVHEFFKQMAESDPQQLQQVNQSIDTARQTVGMIVLVLRILQVVVLVCFLMVGLLRLLPGRAFFTWIAWILFIPGVEVTVFSALLVYVPQFVEQQIVANNPEFGQIIPVTAVVQSLIRVFSITTLWIGVGLVGVGVVLFVFSRFLKKKMKSAPLVPASAPTAASVSVPPPVMVSSPAVPVALPATNTPLPATQRTKRKKTNAK